MYAIYVTQLIKLKNISAFWFFIILNSYILLKKSIISQLLNKMEAIYGSNLQLYLKK